MLTGVEEWSVVGRAALLIFLAEIGDKTFFVAVLLSAKYHACPVFVGCMLALALSTLIAAAVGYLLARFIDPVILTFVAAALFLVFAAWLLWEWYNYDETESAEKEAEEDLANAEGGTIYGSAAGNTETARSSTDSFSRNSLSWWKIATIAFSMNFIGELGDKTQIAVAVQASTADPIWVAVGALIGFALVTAIAVVFGKAIARLLSPRALLLVAAAAFSFFGVLALVQGINLINEPTAPRDTQLLTIKMVTAGLLKSFPEISFFLQSPVKGTSWSFQTVFGCGLVAGVLLAVVIGLIWRCCFMRGSAETEDGSRAASSWEPIPDNSNVEYAPMTLHLFTHRCGWLVALLLVQSLSAEVLESFKVLLRDHPNIIYFLTMLVGAGGNAGVQSAVLGVRMMALKQDVRLAEQLVTGCKLAAILAFVVVVRCLCFGGMQWAESSTIAVALAIIVIIAILIGTALPLLLGRVRVDPAHSIATIQVFMDILGCCITCFIGVLILDYVLATPHE